MLSEPFWITADVLVEVNRELVSDTGEPHAVRSLESLESACGRPPALWHYGDERDMAALASSLLFGVAGNHPFIQGNKRTAFAGAVVFLEANNHAVVHDSADATGLLADLVLSWVESRDDAAFVAAFRPFVIGPLP